MGLTGPVPQGETKTAKKKKWKSPFSEGNPEKVRARGKRKKEGQNIPRKQKNGNKASRKMGKNEERSRKLIILLPPNPRLLLGKRTR